MNNYDYDYTLEEQLKREFFDNLFTQKNGAIECNNKYFNKSLNLLKRMYNDYLTHDDIMQEAMIASYETIDSFKIKFGSWHNMINETDVDNLNMLFKKIQKKLRGVLFETAYDVHQVTIDNEAYYISNKFDSLNIQSKNEDGEYDEMINTLSVDTSFFNLYADDFAEADERIDDYYNKKKNRTKDYNNKFINHFLDNKEEILTNIQLEYYDKMIAADDSDGYTSVDYSEQIGMNKQNVKRMFDNVNTRTTDYFKADFTNGKYEKLTAFYNASDAEQLEFVRENVNLFKVDLSEEMTTEEFAELRKALRNKNIDVTIVHYAKMILIDKYHDLSDLNRFYFAYNPVKFYKKDNEKSDFDVRAALKKYNEFTQHSEVKVYKNGELVDVVTNSSQLKQDKIKSLNEAQQLLNELFYK